MNAEQFAEHYWASLHKYLDDPSEVQRSKACELGRHALADGLGVLDIAAAHYGALQRVVSARARRAVPDELSRRTRGRPRLAASERGAGKRGEADRTRAARRGGAASCLGALRCRRHGG